MMTLPTTFALMNMAPDVLMTFSSLILQMLRAVAIGRVSFKFLFGMGGFVFCLRTLVRVSACIKPFRQPTDAVQREGVLTLDEKS